MELSDILLIKPEQPLICIIKNFDYTKKNPSKARRFYLYALDGFFSIKIYIITIIYIFSKN